MHVVHHATWLHWLSHFGGDDNPGGRMYLAQSGWVSNVISLLLAMVASTALWKAFRHWNCHTHGCWRHARFPVAGGKYHVCKKCIKRIDPDHKGHLTIDDLTTEHQGHLTNI